MRAVAAGSEWKSLNCDIVSIVPPDLEETMNSVLSRSIASIDRLDLVRVRGVEHVQRIALARADERRNTSGARLEPPMPSSTASV